MVDHSQEPVIAFLTDPATYGLPGPVARIDTHISHVFLAGPRAFKLKRAVSLPYLDFSTPDRRLETCEKELALNRRTAPDLYLGVRRITAGAAGCEFDGTGPLLDAVVEMQRFDQDVIFDKLALHGKLTFQHLDALASEISTFHTAAQIEVAAAGAENIASVLDINDAGFRQSTVFTEDEISRLSSAFRASLTKHAAQLDARAKAGQVRRCHGDLHLRNVCLYQGRVRLFDCLEFNDALATVDLLYDLAFLVMDLWHRGLHAEASHVTNRYFDTSGQEDGYNLMPFFTALRAAVRAHVTATQAEFEAANQKVLADEARSYFDLAEQLLAPVAPRLVAIGGLSGSGKSTLAHALAPHLGQVPGARVISSDRTRKAMFDVAPHVALKTEAYTPEVSERVYAAMTRRAQKLMSNGVTVIADAVHARRADRAQIEAAAHNVNARFDGLWLQADPDLLYSRLDTRDPGASDADADVLAKQLARAPTVVDWQTVSTAGSLSDSVASALQRLNATCAQTSSQKGGHS